MIANVLFSVYCFAAYGSLFLFFFLSFISFSFLPYLLLLLFLSTARSSTPPPPPPIQKRGTRRMRVRIISRNVGFS